MQGGLEQNSVQAQEALTAKQTEYNKQLIERDRLSETLTSKKIRLAELEKELSAALSGLNRTQSEIKRTDELKARLEKEITARSWRI